MFLTTNGMVNKIVTHFRPHADELVALMFLKNFPEGEEKFPGVKNAKVEFLTTGKLPNGKTYQDFPETIFLGVGGGPFDEHETEGQDRAEGEVCASLVANYLGIEKKPELQGVLKIVKQEDLDGAIAVDSLSVIVKFLHSCFKEDYELIYRWSEIGHMAHIQNAQVGGSERKFTYSETKKILQELQSVEYDWWVTTAETALAYQKEQYQKALKEFDQKAIKRQVTCYDGAPVNISYIESDNEEMGKAARSRMSQLIVQKSSRGNVFMFTSWKRHLDLTSIIVLLRLAEQHFEGAVKVTDTKTLSQIGMITDIPWYLFHARDMIFNGSLTTKDVPPTKIPSNKLLAIVEEGIGKQFTVPT